MPQIYVANLTKQNHIFVYRHPDTNGIVPQNIAIGQQAIIGNTNWKPEQAAKIVAQHERYGLREVNSISRKRGFIGLCYSFDRPIELEQFAQMMEGNDEALNQRASERREELATMIKHNMDRVAEDAGVRERAINRLEVELVQQGENFESPKGEPSVAEGIEVASVSRHNAKARRSKGN
jgi:hypothetical protein